ncbi:unnamed protein product [Adineta steineri]|uniref:Uncharacterized protein n=1 Tax=Adineta steineri TaxID=433720 RepID=A0A819PUI8_9BILA|nr:unnamed protein product [Adineta steineri]
MARTKFFIDLNSLVTATNDLEGQNAALRFCRSVYEFARLQRMLPDEVWTNTEEEEDRFKVQFEPGIIAFAAELRGITSVPRAANLYTVKLYLSAFEFIRTDLMQLYEKMQGANPTTELQKAMSTIESQQFFLTRSMDHWEFDHDFYHPNKWELPCLEGMPKEHKWWNKELGITVNYDIDDVMSLADFPESF